MAILYFQGLNPSEPGDPLIQAWRNNCVVGEVAHYLDGSARWTLRMCQNIRTGRMERGTNAVPEAKVALENAFVAWCEEQGLVINGDTKTVPCDYAHIIRNEVTRLQKGDDVIRYMQQRLTKRRLREMPELESHRLKREINTYRLQLEAKEEELSRG